MSTQKWSLDPTHSEVQFKVKHLMITNVTGQFNVINAEIESDGDDFGHSRVSFTADTTSLTTANEQRDGHLKSADFFDTEQYPTLSFVSDNFDPNSGQITGQLTIKDTSHPVTFDVEFAGTGKDPWGNEKAGFSLSGKINRTDFGLTWNAALETGGVLVSEEVKIQAEVQFVKAQTA